MPKAWLQGIKAWAPAVCWAGFILLASSIPGQELPKVTLPHLDKVVHLGFYAVLGFLLSLSGTSFAHCLKLAALFGLVDELYQTLTPERSPDPADWVCDVIGASIGIYLGQRCLAWKQLQE